MAIHGAFAQRGDLLPPEHEHGRQAAKHALDQPAPHSAVSSRSPTTSASSFTFSFVFTSKVWTRFRVVHATSSEDRFLGS